MIYLFTDFGREGPYVGQMHAVLAQQAAGVPVIDLMHDAPACAPRPAAYLLAALATEMPGNAVCCAVVDPGVGTDRAPVAVEADRRWFVGPGNGLFELIARRAHACRQHRIVWLPDALSASFHGRDLFAPIAAHLASTGDLPPDWLAPLDDPGPGADWLDDLAEVIYVDRFGNLVTGMRADRLSPDATLAIAGQTVAHARTFGDAQPDTPFWYGNSSGLVEIAVRKASAATLLSAGIGTSIAADAAR